MVVIWSSSWSCRECDSGWLDEKAIAVVKREVCCLVEHAGAMESASDLVESVNAFANAS